MNWWSLTVNGTVCLNAHFSSIQILNVVSLDFVTDRQFSFISSIFNKLEIYPWLYCLVSFLLELYSLLIMEKFLILLFFHQLHFRVRQLHPFTTMNFLQERCYKVFGTFMLLNKSSLSCLLRI